MRAPNSPHIGATLELVIWSTMGYILHLKAKQVGIAFESELETIDPKANRTSLATQST